ncbi:MAG TPA: sulfatase-like hydrolase/transferase, partial [Gemmatimonadales bacterium]|nr:sulfatase-like hydrolase/transferase [Gemmatimonadales bacterium]
THYPVNADTLLAAYRALSQAPLPNRPTAFRGRAAGYDVLLLVLETAPSAVIGVGSGESLPPTLRELSRNAFLAPQHHTTYPYTTRAIFSIFTSWYPGNNTFDVTKRLEEEGKGVMLPGIVRDAANAGYTTALFGPDSLDNFEHDRSRFLALGFDSLFTPAHDSLPLAVAGAQGTSAGDVRRQRATAKDQAALALLKQRIQRAVATNQRYFYSFLPQYTHAPWPDVTAASSQAQVFASGRQLFQVVDDWLGEIVAELRALGTLDRTLVVVVGDHGIRTRLEHPNFVAGTLDAISFHVPFLISAPGVLSRPYVVPWVTSHIDVSPTLAELLGFSGERSLEMGSPIWEPALRQRTTYFFARNYFGADGYFANDSVYMFKYPIQSSFSAPWGGALDFRLGNMLPPGSATATEIADRVDRMTVLQESWSHFMLPEHYHTVFPPGPASAGR